MLKQPTLEKLRGLRLPAMAEAFEQQQRSTDFSSMSFDERLGLLVDAEWNTRENNRLGRVLKEARLRLPDACVEAIDYKAERALDKSVVRQLASCTWIAEHQNILITGKTGTGKTYVACALAQQACRKGFRAMYRRAPRFFDELRLARADGSLQRLLIRVAKIDVLIIDDFALAPMTDADRRDLLEVLEDRHDLRSTIITSQLDPPDWHHYLADPTLADAVCDRVIHQAHRLKLEGPSRRINDKNQND